MSIQSFAIDAIVLSRYKERFFIFLPFSLLPCFVGSFKKWKHNSSFDHPTVAHSELMVQPSSPNCGTMLSPGENKAESVSPAQTGNTTSSKATEPWMFLHNRKALKLTSEDLILKSWRDSTKRQYNVYISKWFRFCGERTEPTINNVLPNFYLTLKYRSQGTARSAISTFLKICSNIDVNSFEEIIRFMK